MLGKTSFHIVSKLLRALTRFSHFPGFVKFVNFPECLRTPDFQRTLQSYKVFSESFTECSFFNLLMAHSLRSVRVWRRVYSGLNHLPESSSFANVLSESSFIEKYKT